MKFQVVLLGVLICLAAQAAGRPGQGATTSESVSTAPQTLTGCVDERNGQYVLLDNQMRKIARLQPAGPDKEVFAKHLGRMVKVRGTKSAGQNDTFTVTGIEQIPGNCGQAK
jgi:hypothetical protein